MKLTIKKLFEWYAGEDWYSDWQTTNTMVVNNNHAQEDDEDGMSHLRFLKDFELEEVDIFVEDVGNCFEINFELMGKNFSMDSIENPEEDVDLRFEK